MIDSIAIKDLPTCNISISDTAGAEAEVSLPHRVMVKPISP